MLHACTGIVHSQIGAGLTFALRQDNLCLSIECHTWPELSKPNEKCYMHLKSISPTWIYCDCVPFGGTSSLWVQFPGITPMLCFKTAANDEFLLSQVYLLVISVNKRSTQGSLWKSCSRICLYTQLINKMNTLKHCLNYFKLTMNST